jgi:putative PIN family toxin of toxin-antitoxin system
MILEIFQSCLMTAYMLSSGNVIRIVVDTNVFVAALLQPLGQNRNVLRACLAGKALPLMGAALFHEYEDLMGRNTVMQQSPVPARDRQVLFDAFLAVCEWIKIYYLWRPNLPDEADNHLVELAVAGGASALVTNNVRDVRSGELSFPALKILTPRQFLEEITWQP